jgi:hypothetical protein
MSGPAGTIRKREAKTVVSDLLAQRGVSRALYNITPGGKLHMLIGGREVVFACGRGLTYYGLNDLLKQVNKAVDEMALKRDERQIDLEDAIKAKSKELVQARLTG